MAGTDSVKRTARAKSLAKSVHAALPCFLTLLLMLFHPLKLFLHLLFSYIAILNHLLQVLCHALLIHGTILLHQPCMADACLVKQLMQ